MSEKSFYDKISSIDVRLIYVSIALVLSSVIINPIGMPITIGEHATNLYNFIEQLPEDSLILIGIDFDVGLYSEMGFSLEAIIKHISSRGLRFIALSIHMDGPVNWAKANSRIDFPSNYIYGEDYVYLGFIAGQETAQAAIASDLKKVVTSDFMGIPFSELPIMNGVENSQDFAFIIEVTGQGHNIDSTARQYGSMFNRPLAYAVAGAAIPLAMPYYPRLALAVLPSIIGAAQYEYLADVPSSALKATDAVSLAHIFLFGLLILSHIGFWGQLSKAKRSGGKIV